MLPCGTLVRLQKAYVLMHICTWSLLAAWWLIVHTGNSDSIYLMVRGCTRWLFPYFSDLVKEIHAFPRILIYYFKWDYHPSTYSANVTLVCHCRVDPFPTQLYSDGFGPRCCWDRLSLAHYICTSCVAQIETSCLPVSLSHTPGLRQWPWRAICHAETLSHTHTRLTVYLTQYYGYLGWNKPQLLVAVLYHQLFCK